MESLVTPTSTPTTSLPSKPLDLQKKIGVLARQSRLSDPHTPVWVSGLCYPVQYVVRQTRSMVSKGSDGCHGDEQLMVSVPLNKLSLLTQTPSVPTQTPSVPIQTSSVPTQAFKWPSVMLVKKLIKPLDFFLPDEIFLTKKLEKLREIKLLKKTSTHTPQMSFRDVLRPHPPRYREDHISICTTSTVDTKTSPTHSIMTIPTAIEDNLFNESPLSVALEPKPRPSPPASSLSHQCICHNKNLAHEVS